MSVKIIHLSDLHLGENPNDDDEISNFRDIKDRIKDNYKAEETLIIITGDIVDNGGERVQYINAANEIKELYDANFKVWPIPGNHEYGPGGIAKLNTLKNFKKEIVDKNAEPTLKGDVKYPQVKEFFGHYFFGLDSLEESPPAPPLFEYGKLESYQINELKKNLEAARDESHESKRIVFLHNHPFRFKRIIKRSRWSDVEEDVIPYLWNWKEFMEALKGLADVLLFGHQHYFVNFSNSYIAKDYKIGFILSCGKSTGGKPKSKEGSPEYGIDRYNRVDLNSCLTPKLYGWEIAIDGTIQVKPLRY